VRGSSCYLKAKGYRIIIAKNGEEAINLTKLHHPDLILMDIQMPVIDGLEAMRQIRQDSNCQSIPIIVITALAMEGDRQLCLNAGANDYLSKPLKMRELVTIIEKYLT
jgi:CheY-like chemotaxis protein